MISYKVVGLCLSLNGGVVEITQKQYLRRKNCLKHIKGRKYEVLSLTHFKRGEVVILEKEASKAMMGVLEPLLKEKTAKEKAAEKKAEEIIAKAKEEAELRSLRKKKPKRKAKEEAAKAKE